MAIEQSFNKSLEQVGFKTRFSVNGSGSGGGQYVNSNMTCHYRGKKVHIQRYCRSKLNASGGNPPKNSANDLPEWVTMKTVVLV